jgi:hypothetical protein
MRRAISFTMSPSIFVPGSGSIAARTRWIRRSLFTKVPAFSRKVVPGSTTSANSAVGFMKIS